MSKTVTMPLQEYFDLQKANNTEFIAALFANLIKNGIDGKILEKSVTESGYTILYSNHLGHSVIGSGEKKLKIVRQDV
jgi:hypothetical protein